MEEKEMHTVYTMKLCPKDAQLCDTDVIVLQEQLPGHELVKRLYEAGSIELSLDEAREFLADLLAIPREKLVGWLRVRTGGGSHRRTTICSYLVPALMEHIKIVSKA